MVLHRVGHSWAQTHTFESILWLIVCNRLRKVPTLSKLDTWYYFHFYLISLNIGKGNGNPFQYSRLENPMYGGARWVAVHGVTKSWTRIKQYPKQKQYPVVDVTGDRSKFRCCKEQYCIRTWNVRSMNQGNLEVVKQEMARVNVDILGIS